MLISVLLHYYEFLVWPTFFIIFSFWVYFVGFFWSKSVAYLDIFPASSELTHQFIRSYKTDVSVNTVIIWFKYCVPGSDADLESESTHMFRVVFVINSR